MSRRRSAGHNRSVSGFTLLELLVAVALMAALAIFSWRGLDAVIGARDDITRHTDRLRSLTIAFGQLEDDLRRAWYARLIVGTEPVVTLREDEELPGVMVLGLLRLAPSAVLAARAGDRSDRAADALPLRNEALLRVVWRFRGGRFERGSVAWQPGVGAVGPWVWQPVVDGVDGLQWRVWTEGQGWLSQTVPRTEASNVPGEPNAVLARPPGGVELTLSVAGERIVRVLAAVD